MANKHINIMHEVGRGTDSGKKWNYAARSGPVRSADVPVPARLLDMPVTMRSLGESLQ